MPARLRTVAPFGIARGRPAATLRWPEASPRRLPHTRRPPASRGCSGPGSVDTTVEPQTKRSRPALHDHKSPTMSVLENPERQTTQHLRDDRRDAEPIAKLAEEIGGNREEVDRPSRVEEEERTHVASTQRPSAVNSEQQTPRKKILIDTEGSIAPMQETPDLQLARGIRCHTDVRRIWQRRRRELRQGTGGQLDRLREDEGREVFGLVGGIRADEGQGESHAAPLLLEHAREERCVEERSCLALGRDGSVALEVRAVGVRQRGGRLLLLPELMERIASTISGESSPRDLSGTTCSSFGSVIATVRFPRPLEERLTSLPPQIRRHHQVCNQQGAVERCRRRGQARRASARTPLLV